MTKLTQRLLNRASRASEAFAKAQADLTSAFNGRYGVTYSDVDADQIIDVLDYGGGDITVAECDEVMTGLGHPPKIKEKRS